MNHQMNGGGMNHGNQGMMGGDQSQAVGFLPAQGKDIASFPEAKPTQILDVQDGQTISLNPTIVRKMINGTDIAMYGYNGEIPGPTIKVKQGSTFTVNVTNNIDVPTTVHWHGLRLDNANDGAAGLTQEEIIPGASFTYTVKVPDEGMYWYHTHVREDLQQPMGLYGAILVTPKKKDAYEPVDREETIILNDLLLDAQGSPVPYGRNEADHTLMGRFGNTFLVNGQQDARLDVQLGEVVRFFILNASNTRTYRIIAPPLGMMKLVGGDNGRLEKEQVERSITIAPSERVIVDINFLDDDVNRGMPASKTIPLVVAGSEERSSTVLPVKIDGGVYQPSKTFSTLRAHKDVIADIDAFRPFFTKPVDKTLVLDMDMMGNGSMGGHGSMADVPKDGIEWEDTMGAMNTGMMGNMMTWKMIDEETGAANDKIVYSAKVGDKLKIRIINKKDSPHPMQHPIHFHGQRFLVLSDNGVENKNLVWKDTTLVPAGHTVDILIDINNPGDWMFHCHIAEHLSNGMMGLLKVR
jgi:FtsP/CotA-like multicopper oxidase with cupredoxin domain